LPAPKQVPTAVSLSSIEHVKLACDGSRAVATERRSAPGSVRSGFFVKACFQSSFSRESGVKALTANKTPLFGRVVAATLAGVGELEMVTNMLVPDPTDNLILHSILADARARPVDAKALLTGNTRDFCTPHVEAALKAAAINKHFTNVTAALGWLGSLKP